MTLDEASALLKALIARCQQQLFSEREFRDELQSVLTRFENLGLTITSKVEADRGTGNFDLAATYGKAKGPNDEALGSNNRTEGSFRFVVEGWYRQTEGLEVQRARDIYYAAFPLLADLFIEHWGQRDTMTLLPNFRVSGQQQRLQKAVRTALRNGESITVAHLDLDFFKQINTELGENGGDAVLREFGERIRTSLAENCIAVRKGGEEFSAFFLNEGLRDVLPQLERFRQLMARTAFTATSRPNTCSIGVCSYPLHLAMPSAAIELAEALLNQAMEAERRAKSDGRNCIRIARPIPLPTASAEDSVLESDLMEASLWARHDLSSHLTSTSASDLHAFLAQYLLEQFASASRDQLDDVLKTCLHTFGIDVVASRSILGYDNEHADTSVNPIQLGAIAIRALLTLALVGAGPLKRDDKLHFVLPSQGGDNSTLSIELRSASAGIVSLTLHRYAAAQEPLDVYAGAVWSPVGAESEGVTRWISSDPNASLSPVLLLAVGQSSLQLQIQPWVAAVVEVDDRPVSGGGLPDFWQSNVSRVVHATLSNPNIACILVVGDVTKAARTVDVLKSPGASPYALAQRISVDMDALDAFHKRRLAIVHSPADKATAIRFIYDAYFKNEDGLRATGGYRNLREERLQQRRISIPSSAAAADLLSLDGVRCPTLAEAYPRIVHLLRSSTVTEQSDHMSRRFRELTAFKLVLETPSRDPVPSYWSQEVTTLDDYVTKQFVNSDGLFAQAFAGASASGDFVDQYKEAVKAAAQAIIEGVASRRIIMIAGHPNGDWHKPLGLVAVHVVPRMVANRWRLSFHWVWRTVEALVGLPFSAYGSIRSSESILKAVAVALQERAVSVEMGELTYVALSLHMFCDEGDKDIARTIVLDAYE